MKIDKKIIENCKDALNFFKKNEKAEKYVKLRDGDEKYIEWWVEKGSWYYGKEFVYWSGNVYGFTFGFDLLED